MIYECPKCNRYGMEWDGRAKFLICCYKDCNHVIRIPNQIAIPDENTVLNAIENDTKQKCQYDSKWDGTDAACPAFWRGEKWSVDQFCRLIAEVLSGKNDCTGRMHEPLETVRNNVFKLKQERNMYREYSYYVGSELTCGRTPNKYCKWLSEKS